MIDEPAELVLYCPKCAKREFGEPWEVADPDPHRFDGDHGVGCET